MSEYKSPILIHPGETLNEILKSTGMTQVELSKRTGLHTKTINEIVKGKKPISPNTALKLSIVFGTSEKFWNNLQKNYDETVAGLEHEKELEGGKEIVQKYTVYSQLVKYGLVSDARTIRDKAENILHFFAVASFAVASFVPAVALVVLAFFTSALAFGFSASIPGLASVLAFFTSGSTTASGTFLTSSFAAGYSPFSALIKSSGFSKPGTAPFLIRRLLLAILFCVTNCFLVNVYLLIGLNFRQI